MPLLDEKPEIKLEREVLEWADAVYDEAERELVESREIKLTSRLIDYINSQQWSMKARFGRSRPVVNRTFRHFIEMAGLLTDIQPDFKVQFHDDSDEYSDLEKLLNEMIIIWDRMTGFQDELVQAVMWALIHTGFSKVQWNPAMHAGMGDTEFLPLGPLNVMTVGSEDKLQPSECVVARWPVTVESLYWCYPKEIVNQIIPDLDSAGPSTDRVRPAKMHETTWMRLNPPLRNLLGQKQPMAKPSRYPKTMLKQFWFRDRAKNESGRSRVIGDPRYNWSYIVEPGDYLFPRGRFVVISGGKVLQDGPNPYWHAMYPFAKLRLYRVPWSRHGLSPLEPISLMQDIINRINGGIMDMIRANIEPRIMAPKAAFSQSVWDSLDPGAPGGKIMYNNNSPRAPEQPKGPELPSYIQAFKNDVEKEQDASSGSAAISQAMQKKQVPGGDSLEMIMNSKSIPIRFMGRGLTTFLNEVGTMVVATKMQFENARRRVMKFGAKGLTDQDFEPHYQQFLQAGMQPESFVRQVTFSIKKGSLLSIEKEDEMSGALVLRKLGDISRRGLLRKVGLNKKEIDTNEQELIAEAKEKIALAGMAGQAQHAGKK